MPLDYDRARTEHSSADSQVPGVDGKVLINQSKRGLAFTTRKYLVWTLPYVSSLGDPIDHEFAQSQQKLIDAETLTN